MVVGKMWETIGRDLIKYPGAFTVFALSIVENTKNFDQKVGSGDRIKNLPCITVERSHRYTTSLGK